MQALSLLFHHRRFGWLRWLVLLTLFVAGAAFAQPISPTVRRVVFLGNSITYAGTYITDLEAYYRIRHPDQVLEFINVGLPSETVSGLSEEGHADGRFPRPDLHERLERVLVLTKPDLVFACYGMNDGIYLPFAEERFQKFKDGMNWLHRELAKTGARIIHLTPPDYDETKGQRVGYAAVLDRYADWLLAQRKAQQWEVVDIHYPMQHYLRTQRQKDTDFALAADGIHPGEAGHWLMAREILRYLGEKAVAQAPTVQTVIQTSPHHQQIFELVARRQAMMKDAWLTAARHQRPEMTVGLPLSEARAQYEQLEEQLRALSK